ncbi:hypothetical protein [Sinorhizobium meliloti]|uniref:hypothetical protein n=1 Tax=Rhizobium meliloti TaxID=382 RepID=UPI000D1FCA04|nr:hypothetical protein [Sinorhizobium meliloti]RMI21352.1 hypothetical protein DA102_002040 [Sinorhizobium meliloti]
MTDLEPTDEEIRRVAIKLGAPIPKSVAERRLPARINYEVVMGGRDTWHIMRVAGETRKFLRTVASQAEGYAIVRQIKEDAA